MYVSRLEKKIPHSKNCDFQALLSAKQSELFLLSNRDFGNLSLRRHLSPCAWDTRARDTRACLGQVTGVHKGLAGCRAHSVLRNGGAQLIRTISGLPPFQGLEMLLCLSSAHLGRSTHDLPAGGSK